MSPLRTVHGPTPTVRSLGGEREPLPGVDYLESEPLSVEDEALDESVAESVRESAEALRRLRAEGSRPARGRDDGMLLAARLGELGRRALRTGDAEDETSAEPSADERRHLPRHGGAGTVTICRISAAGPLDANALEWRLRSSSLCGNLQDLTMISAAFELPEPLPEGERVGIRLANPHRHERLDTAARVVRCAQAEQNRWRIVCRFVDVLPLDEVSRYGRHLFTTELV